MILLILAAIPLVGAVTLVALGSGPAPHQRPKVVALAFSLAALVASLVMLASYDTSGADAGPGGYQMTIDVDWISAFGAHFALGVNGIGVTLILLTTVLTPLVVLAAWGDRLPDPRPMGPIWAK